MHVCILVERNEAGHKGLYSGSLNPRDVVVIATRVQRLSPRRFHGFPLALTRARANAAFISQTFSHKIMDINDHYIIQPQAFTKILALKRPFLRS